MPIGKDIYKVLSKHQDRKKLGVDTEQVAPATIDQWRVNSVTRAKSKNVHITELAGPKRRMISPNEGIPAVNGKSGEEVKEKFIHKPRLINVKVDVTAGAIEPTKTKKVAAPNKIPKARVKKCSNCHKPGHTKRTCTE